MKIENRLKELNIELPEAPAPLAAYIPCRRSGNLVFVSGQGSSFNGKETFQEIGRASCRERV